MGNSGTINRKSGGYRMVGVLQQKSRGAPKYQSSKANLNRYRNGYQAGYLFYLTKQKTQQHYVLTGFSSL